MRKRGDLVFVRACAARARAAEYPPLMVVDSAAMLLLSPGCRAPTLLLGRRTTAGGDNRVCVMRGSWEGTIQLRCRARSALRFLRLFVSHTPHTHDPLVHLFSSHAHSTPLNSHATPYRQRTTTQEQTASPPHNVVRSSAGVLVFQVKRSY